VIKRKGGNSLLLVVLHDCHLIDDIVNHLLGETVAFQRAFDEDVAVTAARCAVLGHLDHICVGAHSKLFDHIALLANDEPHAVIGNGQQEGLVRSYVVTRRSGVSGHGLVFEEISSEGIQLEFACNGVHLDGGRVGCHLLS